MHELVILQATTVHNKRCAFVKRNSATVIILTRIAFNVYVLENYICSVNVDTACTVVAPTAGNGTVLDYNVSILVDIHNFAIGIHDSTISVDGVTVQVDGYFCILRDIDGIVFEAVIVNPVGGKETVCRFPVGLEFNNDTAVAGLFHITGVAGKSHSGAPALFKVGVVADKHDVVALIRGDTKKRTSGRLG